MIDLRSLDDLASRLASLVPPGLRSAETDLRDTFRATLQAGLTRMNLVTREEFEVQKLVLQQTREKLEALEKLLAERESKAG